MFQLLMVVVGGSVDDEDMSSRSAAAEPNTLVCRLRLYLNTSEVRGASADTRSGCQRQRLSQNTTTRDESSGLQGLRREEPEDHDINLTLS